MFNVFPSVPSVKSVCDKLKLVFIFVCRPMVRKVLAQHMIKNGDVSRTACLRNRITIILSKLEA